MKQVPIYYGLMHTRSGPVVEGPFVERHRAPDGPKPDRHCSNCGIDFHAAAQDTGRTE